MAKDNEKDDYVSVTIGGVKLLTDIKNERYNLKEEIDNIVNTKKALNNGEPELDDECMAILNGDVDVENYDIYGFDNEKAQEDAKKLKRIVYLNKLSHILDEAEMQNRKRESNKDKYHILKARVIDDSLERKRSDSKYRDDLIDKALESEVAKNGIANNNEEKVVKDTVKNNDTVKSSGTVKDIKNIKDVEVIKTKDVEKKVNEKLRRKVEKDNGSDIGKKSGNISNNIEEKKMLHINKFGQEDNRNIDVIKNSKNVVKINAISKINYDELRGNELVSAIRKRMVELGVNTKMIDRDTMIKEFGIPLLKRMINSGLVISKNNKYTMGM